MASKKGKIIKTVISGFFIIVMVGVIIAANSLLTENSRVVNNIMGGNQKVIDNSKVDTSGLDLNYNISDFSKDEISAAEDDLEMRMSAEGLVLLQNSNSFLPLKEKKDISIFSVNGAKLQIGGGIFGGGTPLKDIFESSGFKVNSTLHDFYTKGDGSNYGLGPGSISYGDAEDFKINEAPLSALQKDSKVLDSVKGTLPVYVFKRVAGEGRDMPRSMYTHTDKDIDKTKSYLEPDSVELEVLQYLNDNYDEFIVVVNSNAAVELDWISNYPSIKSVILAPDGLKALPGILTGEYNPSGRTVDTFAVNALASPAAENIGDFQYYKTNGEETKYNYVVYKEGIYVGYKYYETRYEDYILGQGNAGDFNYNSEVTYPFGFGLSYTTFNWANQTVVDNGDTLTLSVDVTNTGNVKGKEVVELYAQSPYTDYDKQYNVEKESVRLVGYTKTKELEAGETTTVSVTFNKEQLKSYDYTNAKTYILEAGDYYLTLAKDAHAGVNNILSAKGYDVTGNSNLVSVYTPNVSNVDSTTYATDSYSGTEVTNHLDFAKGDYTYLTRNDWLGSWPTVDGVPSDKISSWGNGINGTDANGNPASYTLKKEISDSDLAKLDSFDSLSPVDPSTIVADIVYGKHNGLSLIELRGLEFNDPKWDDLLDQLTSDEIYNAIAVSGYGIENIDSINMPFIKDADTAAGLIYGGTGKMFPNMMVLAQTWNQDLALEYGKMIGNDAVIGGADGWYAPSMNIHRTPFSGRNGEYYSEDPFLSGAVASQEVLGAASKGMYTYIKHFAFNDQENHRGDRDGQFGLATWLNEQSAREIYLKPFEMSMKVGTVTQNYLAKNESGEYVNKSREIPASQGVMTAFNRVGYTWTGGAYPLITEILRNEWSFNGLIITDNANTSLFMDCFQMVEAGADIKLTSLTESARFNYDRNDKVTYHYTREAMHRMLYTVVNSKAMNGAMPGSVFVTETSFSTKLKNIINIACPIIIVILLGLTILRHVRKPKKED